MENLSRTRVSMRADVVCKCIISLANFRNESYDNLRKMNRRTLLKQNIINNGAKNNDYTSGKCFHF